MKKLLIVGTVVVLVAGAITTAIYDKLEAILLDTELG